MFEQALEGAGGSLGTWIVLSAVSDEVGFISHRIVARRAHVDGATITYHVDRAERLGLVVREVDPDDRRVKRLRLTPAGASSGGAASTRAQEPQITTHRPVRRPRSR